MGIIGRARRSAPARARLFRPLLAFAYPYAAPLAAQEFAAAQHVLADRKGLAVEVADAGLDVQIHRRVFIEFVEYGRGLPLGVGGADLPHMAHHDFLRAGRNKETASA